MVGMERDVTRSYSCWVTWRDQRDTIGVWSLLCSIYRKWDKQLMSYFKIIFKALWYEWVNCYSHNTAEIGANTVMWLKQWKQHYMALTERTEINQTVQHCILTYSQRAYLLRKKIMQVFLCIIQIHIASYQAWSHALGGLSAYFQIAGSVSFILMLSLLLYLVHVST